MEGVMVKRGKVAKTFLLSHQLCTTRIPASLSHLVVCLANVGLEPNRSVFIFFRSFVIYFERESTGGAGREGENPKQSPARGGGGGPTRDSNPHTMRS